MGTTDTLPQPLQELVASMSARLTPAQRQRMRGWAHALESGDYQQVREMLHTDEGFCCLGVACHLLNPDGWVLVADVNPGYIFTTNGHDSTKWLPSWHVADEYGWDHSDPLLVGTVVKACTITGNEDVRRNGHLPQTRVVVSAQGVHLGALSLQPGDCVLMQASWWNDAQQLSFKEIAALVRQTYLGEGQGQ